jgi:hypothetical protein
MICQSIVPPSTSGSCNLLGLPECFSPMSVTAYQSTCPNIPENLNLQQNLSQNLKSVSLSVTYCWQIIRWVSVTGLHLVPFAVYNTNIRIYTAIIFPAVLYECETWSLTLREEYRLSVSENRVLRKTLGSKMKEVKGDWRKLHDDKPHNLYSLPHVVTAVKSRRIR